MFGASGAFLFYVLVQMHHPCSDECHNTCSPTCSDDIFSPFLIYRYVVFYDSLSNLLFDLVGQDSMRSHVPKLVPLIMRGFKRMCSTVSLNV